jgi:TB2/DP1, HVA22 family
MEQWTNSMTGQQMAWTGYRRTHEIVSHNDAQHCSVTISICTVGLLADAGHLHGSRAAAGYVCVLVCAPAMLVVSAAMLPFGGTLAAGIQLCMRGMCRMPLYYEAKLLFVVWLWHPRSKGAVYLYQHSLQPLLLAHEQTIDRKIEEFKAMGGDFVAGNFSK